MNVIIPIAGMNKTADGTEYIKSLQEIERKTILQYVFESLQDVKASHFIVVVKREDVDKYHLDNIVRLLRPEAEVIIATGNTQGAVCTCLLSVDNLAMDEPLLITGSDQILLEPPSKILTDFQAHDYDGGVAIFDDVHPRWSYVRLDDQQHVIEAAEKRPISRNAVAGFYYYKKASDFIEAAHSMILKSASVNGSFFICPVFNEMILKQKTIGVYRIQKSQYYSFSHNSGIEAYKNYLAAQRKEAL